jgi:protein O-GlcNAc transferase
VFSIFDLLPAPPPTILLVDVGAQDDPEVPNIYEPLERSGCVTVIGFEPIQAECDRLNARAGPGRRYLPYAVGEGDSRTLRVCSYSAASSLYEPNLPLLDHFTNLASLLQVVERVPLRTVRLDDIEEVRHADYLKLDAQGAEADVLRGASRVLEETLVVFTEAEFVPLYEGQTLLAGVDTLLRAHGFLFHKFTECVGRAFHPVEVNNDPNRGCSQLLWCNAVYVKSFLEFGRLSPESLLKLAILLHEIHASYDFCLLALRHYDAQTGTALGPAYLDRLIAAGPTPVPRARI